MTTTGTITPSDLIRLRDYVRAMGGTMKITFTLDVARVAPRAKREAPASELAPAPGYVMSKADRGLVWASEKGYRVDDAGVVWRPDGSRQALCVSVGYLSFTSPAAANCDRILVKVHRLAALQRFGADALFQPGIEVRHLNGDPRNNTRENVAVGTRRQNDADKTPENRQCRQIAAAAAFRKLTREQVQEIVTLKQLGVSRRDLATRFGVDDTTVSRIIIGKYYSDWTGIRYHPKRQRRGARRLTSQEARELVLSYHHHPTVALSRLGAKFGINSAAASAILRGHSYADVTADIRARFANQGATK